MRRPSSTRCGLPLRVLPDAVETGAHAGEDGAEHRGRQDTGIRIVARAVIAVEKRHASASVGQGEFRPMAEGQARGGVAQGAGNALVGDAAEGNDRGELRHLGDGLFEKAPAGPDLGRRWLVLGRHAAHRIGDAGVDEFQSIIRAFQIDATGKAEIDQGFVEKIAGPVAGEGAARAVGAAQPRCEANDQQTRRGRAEGGDRRIVPVGLTRARLLAECRQAGA